MIYKYVVNNHSLSKRENYLYKFLQLLSIVEKYDLAES